MHLWCRRLRRVRRCTARLAPSQDESVQNTFRHSNQRSPLSEPVTHELEELIAALDRPLPRIDCVKVVSNLVENAAKYTEPGGSITVTVEQRGDEVVLVVSHNGIGIGAENLERIFEPFTQSHQPLASPSVDWESDSAWCAESWNCDGGHVKASAGLGLAFSRWGAEANDGRLYARNLPDRGSVFTVALSLVLVPAVAAV